jgi:hypothetical protein
VLTFDVVRLLAPVPWLSGRASASHAEGRWFDPSRDHKHLCRPQDFQLCDFRSHAHNGPGYPPSRSSAEPVERIRHTIQVGIVEIRIGVRGDHDRRVAHRHLQ